MKLNIVLKILVVFFLTTNLLYSGALYDDFSQYLSDNLKFIFFILKIVGFGIIVWAISESIKEGANKQESAGLTYNKIILKIFIGSIFIATSEMFTILTGIHT